jgi:pyochelin biosynthetic protein PchC
MNLATTDPDTWIRRFHQAVPGARQLICLPHAGGSASFFHPFSAALAPEIEVLAVQYPGRQDRRREPVPDGVPELAEALYAVLADLPGLDDFAIFGHSMGAVVGFELTRRLEQRRHRPPRRLFASGRRAPSRTRPERAHLLPDADLVDEIAALGGTDPRLLADPEMRELLLPMIRGDYRAVETYRCSLSTTVSCPVTVLTGDADQRTSAAEASDWRLHTTGECAVETLSGGHFFLSERPGDVVRVVSRALR